MCKITSINYIKENEICPNKVLTYFPFGHCSDDLDLNGDTQKYALDATEAEYIMVSNVCNLDDETIDILHRYTPIAHYEKHRVYVTIYNVP